MKRNSDDRDRISVTFWWVDAIDFDDQMLHPINKNGAPSVSLTHSKDARKRGTYRHLRDARSERVALLRTVGWYVFVVVVAIVPTDWNPWVW